jgi:hypothetical protein
MMVHGRTPDEKLLAETERLRMLVGKRLASLLGLPDSVVQPMMVGFMYALGTTPGR